MCPHKQFHTLLLQELRNDAELQEGNLGWLKARMSVLIEICADSDGQRQGSALRKLSADFKGLLASLFEVGEGFPGFIKVPDTDQTTYIFLDSTEIKMLLLFRRWAGTNLFIDV